MSYIIFSVTIFACLMIYFRIARACNIIDKPNQRSSHIEPTIRGGGVIFFVAIFIWFLGNSFQWPWMMLGISLVAIINFLDDINEQPAILRFLVHLVGVLMVFFQVGVFTWSFFLIMIALIVCIGALSAFNFMDGINGITGLYALVNLTSFYIVQQTIPFSNAQLLIFLIVSVFVFLYYNFRTRAVCFAGDVGSVTIAFIQVFFLLQLIMATNNFLWVIMFLVYGIDSVVTILYRLKRRENIFKPHRTHLYQYLANEMKWPHQAVSFAYAFIQGVLNFVVIYGYLNYSYFMPLVAAVIFIIVYLGLRNNISQRILVKGK
ncbi:MAG TPA: UDP-GlcNAc--UDP-phosphate GlcNAc-1-phosphate transferase [Cyclobacteriaceae bacterium]|nr:UDP-GlcNAc--UDP-phosphate GlcNAc-1-phosphate transferase [Cyclobacteriaceae bacterium]